MSVPDTELQIAMEALMAKEIKRLLAQADSCVFVVYDIKDPSMEPHDYRCHERKGDQPIRMDVSLDFEGIGVWYLVFRKDTKFTAKKILLHIESGQFKHGQMGNFKGYWADFPQYITEDRWVQEQLAKATSNQQFVPTDMSEDIADIAHKELAIEQSAPLDTPAEEVVIPDEVKSEPHWYEPPDLKDEKPQVGLFAAIDDDSRDLDEIFAEGSVEVDGFPSQPFSRFGD